MSKLTQSLIVGSSVLVVATIVAAVATGVWFLRGIIEYEG